MRKKLLLAGLCTAAVLSFMACAGGRVGRERSGYTKNRGRCAVDGGDSYPGTGDRR